MLLKPCKVKRFLATAALSEVGLVSSDSEGQRVDQQAHKKKGKDKMSYTLGETETDKKERQKKEEGLTLRYGADGRCFKQQRLCGALVYVQSHLSLLVWVRRRRSRTRPSSPLLS